MKLLVCIPFLSCRGQYLANTIRSYERHTDCDWQLSLVTDAPSAGAVYNIGGGRDSNCSMIEAVAICEELTGRELDRTYEEENRIGDHRWWVSDNRPFQEDYPNWKVEHNTRQILAEIRDYNAECWTP
jgi:CDP-paratose 2-epimerase